MSGNPTIAIFPGTFDPITNGHIDIITRASRIFSNIIIAVAENSPKNVLFSTEERLSMVRQATRNMRGVVVERFTGLVVDFAASKQARVIIRGLRMISDFEYEFQMALTNRNLNEQVETIFLMPHPQYSFVSSRLIKEAGALGADLHAFLPSFVSEQLIEKLGVGGKGAANHENKRSKPNKSRS